VNSKDLEKSLHAHYPGPGFVYFLLYIDRVSIEHARGTVRGGGGGGGGYRGDSFYRDSGYGRRPMWIDKLVFHFQISSLSSDFREWMPNSY
jgi:hypothetical protein